MKKSVKLPILFLAVIFLFIQFPIYALSNNNVPLSYYTNFEILNKSVNSLNIKVTVQSYYLQTPDLKSKLVAEFNNTENPNIYQSKLITMPNNGEAKILIKSIDSVIIPTQDKISISNTTTNSLPLYYIGKTGIMRDLRVAPLTIRQYRYDETTKNIICYKNIDIQLDFSPSTDLPITNSSISETWSTFYQSSVLNYDGNLTTSYSPGLPQGYLIIVADELYNTILPFAHWKNLKGYTVTVKMKSEVGSNATAIRDYIRQAYETWSPRLEYVLLVGSASLLPGVPIPLTPVVGDHLYACVSGNDLYPDLFIGRLPAANTSELSVMLAKLFGYERTPYLGDTLWYRTALMVGTQYSTGQTVWTSLATCRWVRNLLLQHNFLQVDTVFDPPNANGVGIIDTFVNRGVSYVNARGWGNYQGWHRPQFYTSNGLVNLNNGWKLPIVTSFYCGTANYGGTQRSFGEMWLVIGTPTIPKGAVGFYGPTYATTSSRFNNCQDYGVYWGIFEEKLNNFGPACFRGKLEMLENFAVPADSVDLRIHVCTYTVLGDPSMELWTGSVPKQLNVSYPSQIPVGSSSFSVQVLNTSSQPVTNALVSLYKVNEVKATAYTDNAGIAAFNFITQSQDTLFVTVTAHDYIPHLGSVQVTTQPVYVGYYSSSGNIIAGQTNNLAVMLKNYGSGQTASNTIATLRTQDNQVTIIDSVKSYGNISPGQTASSSPFQFTVATNCSNNYRINFQLSIVSSSNNWQAGFTGSVRAPELKYLHNTVIDGGNQILEPGETSNLIVKIINRGLENINNVTGTLRCTNPYAIRVLDSIGSFGTVSAGDSIQNNSDYFTVQVSSSVGIGRKFYFQLILRNPNGYQRIIEFPITIGVISNSSALGPDNYGYWAYDNTDINYSEHPTYNWVEIDPNFGGNGTQITMSYNSIKTLNLPFTFKYYGRNYTKLSVCSKGYLAMDSSWIIDPYNWNIPSPFGPPAMIATFWDDFRPDTLGASGIYYYNDAVNHRFIVEWSRIRHIHGFRDPAIAEMQTFQAIICNQAYFSTRTGDGPIIFQYNTVFNDDSLSSDCHNYATVGIENLEHTDGIEYTFAGKYPISAATIVSGRAIKFTTNLPDTFTGVSEDLKNIILRPQSVEILVSPNPCKSIANILYTIPTESKITINLYDVAGKLVRNLFTGQKNVGNYRFQWLNRNTPPGIYFISLTTQKDKSIIRKNAKIILY